MKFKLPQHNRAYAPEPTKPQRSLQLMVEQRIPGSQGVQWQVHTPQLLVEQAQEGKPEGEAIALRKGNRP